MFGAMLRCNSLMERQSHGIIRTKAHAIWLT
jgi:hypothetical protein